MRFRFLATIACLLLGHQFRTIRGTYRSSTGHGTKLVICSRCGQVVELASVFFPEGGEGGAAEAYMRWFLLGWPAVEEW